MDHKALMLVNFTREITPVGKYGRGWITTGFSYSVLINTDVKDVAEFRRTTMLAVYSLYCFISVNCNI